METTVKRRILFVDDEKMILEGLQRMLRAYRHEWDMVFAQSGREALEIMKTGHFDIVISDMRMPEMDGVALLTQVMEKYPETVRFILSGQSDKDTLIRAVGPTHQFLAKPCEPEALKIAIERALKLRLILSDSRLTQIISKIRNLPSLPDLYVELEREIKSKTCSMQRISQIIERDISMSAKVLQLVNSAFFGLPQKISTPSQAVNLLGTDTIHSLVFMAQVFSSINESSIHSFSLKALWEHSLSVSMRAKSIVQSMGRNKALEDEAFKAGMFHDLGKVVLAVSMPEASAKIVKESESLTISHGEAEYRNLGTSHAEVSAYLLGLWGFADSTLESAAYHHRPSLSPSGVMDATIAVHTADALDHEIQHYTSLPKGGALDIEHLAALGLDKNIPQWRFLWRGRTA